MRSFKPLIFVTLSFYSLCSFSQIKSEHNNIIERYDTSYASIIDSTKVLSSNSYLTYSKGELFKCIHLTNENGEIYLVDVRYLKNYRGYINFDSDIEKLVLFTSRGSGSGNPEYFITINKDTGIKGFFEKRPELNN
ncbi:hypothetical protein [uncultured Aquimarina sp.]|uniref:hypothetical protein n=1 Tax=uncultured Aquimarina sp. TaxID=575652 RepID=UPI00262CA1DA|nr:hypothetical protein [uncultured Aquimarina sp.]